MANTFVLPDKPWYKSLTLIGSIIYTIAYALVVLGVLPAWVGQILEAAGGILAVLGIRRLFGDVKTGQSFQSTTPVASAAGKGADANKNIEK